MKSVWSNSVEFPQFERLEGTVKTDVLIIGGGICGILCAYMLKKSGVDCIVAEANRICSGITKNTTAKITCQHGLIYDKIINKYGLENAQLYYESQKKSLDMYKFIFKNIECDFVESDSYVYSKTNREKIEKEV